MGFFAGLKVEMTDRPVTLRKFILRVEAKPGNRLISEGPEEIIGYYQNLGVTCRNETELIELVRDHIFKDLGSQLINIDELRTPDFEGEDRDRIRELAKTDEIGVWWSSGRFFFYEDDADEQEEQDEGEE